MKKLTENVLQSTVIFILLLGMQSCYYDNEAELYPSTGDCDTANVTYSGTIAPIMAANCNSCHGGVFPNDNVVTENYEGLKVVALDGRLWGAVNHESGYSAVPKDRPQLPDCDLNKIRIWLDEGALNN